MNALLVALGAGVGAPARYLVARRWPGRRGTLTVNILGSALFGIVAGGGGRASFVLVGVGFCGAFTTFSAFAVEAVVPGPRAGVGYVVLSVAASLAAAALGLWAGAGTA